MPKPVGRYRELYWHERVLAVFVERKAWQVFPNRLLLFEMWQDIVHYLLAADLHQKVVHHDPLVVPTHLLLNVAERSRGILVHELVVELQHGRVQLRDDDVFVVAFVPDECPFCGVRIVDILVAWEIARIGRCAILGQRPAKPEFLAIIHVRLIIRAASIQRIKIQTWSTEIHQSIRIV